MTMKRCKERSIERERETSRKRRCDSRRERDVVIEVHAKSNFVPASSTSVLENSTIPSSSPIARTTLLIPVERCTLDFQERAFFEARARARVFKSFNFTFSLQEQWLLFADKNRKVGRNTSRCSDRVNLISLKDRLLLSRKFSGLFRPPRGILMSLNFSKI